MTSWYGQPSISQFSRCSTPSVCSAGGAGSIGGSSIFGGDHDCRVCRSCWCGGRVLHPRCCLVSSEACYAACVVALVGLIGLGLVAAVLEALYLYNCREIDNSLYPPVAPATTTSNQVTIVDSNHSGSSHSNGSNSSSSSSYGNNSRSNSGSSNSSSSNGNIEISHFGNGDTDKGRPGIGSINSSLVPDSISLPDSSQMPSTTSFSSS